MSFSVIFYTFSKRENSTLQPSSTAGRTYNCNLVRDSGIINPTIELKIDFSDNPSGLNYAYIPTFGRYYFINEWTFKGSLWVVSMSVDPLATWKEYIGRTQVYVLRSSAQFDGDIIDMMYPIKDTYRMYITPNSESWWSFSGNSLTTGYFVIGLLSYNASSDTFGGINYYALRPGMFNLLLVQLFDPAGQWASKAEGMFGQLELTVEDAANLLYIAENPYSNYIKSVTWVPDAPIKNLLDGLNFGAEHISSIGCYSLDVKSTAQFFAGFTLTKHPQTAIRGNYVNCEPFTDLQLYLPKLGTVDLDANKFAFRNYLYVSLDVDPITGDGLYKIYASDTEGLQNGIEIQRFYAPVGVQVAITGGKEVGEYASAMGSLFGSIAEIGTNPVGAITSLPAAIANVKKTKHTNGNQIGNNSGWLGIGRNNGTPSLVQTFYDIVDEDNEQNGRPLCKRISPNLLGNGYMLVQDADIQAPATAGELATIRSLMEGGFYFE